MSTSAAHAPRPARMAWRAALILAALSLALVALAPPARAAGPFVVNSTTDVAPAPPNGLCPDSTPGAVCTLREAIQEANFAGTATAITFASALAGATITLHGGSEPLNLNGSAITIDGAGRNITISGNASTDSVFRVQGNGNTIRNLAITSAVLDGIQIGDYNRGVGGGNNNTISGVRLFGNGGAGVYIKRDASGGGSNNTIRESVIGASSFAPATCSASQANTYGVSLDPGVVGARLILNTIICNGTNGISINGAGSASDATRTLIQQNLIGTAGSGDLGNGGAGVSIYGGARHLDLFSNVISGNQQTGVYVTGPATNDIALTGNLVGTSSNGNSAVPNIQAGVLIDSLSGANIVIGGSNRISGNTGPGVWIKGSSGVTVRGSYIGTNFAGSAALPNSADGVQLSDGAHDNIVGGSTANRNVISGNAFSGVSMAGTATANNQVSGNYIGLNAAGSAAVRNGQYGVQLSGSAHDNIVGGGTPAGRNVISGNAYGGVSIEGGGTTGNRIDSNYIGLSAAGSAAIPNGDPGLAASGAGVTVRNAGGNRIGSSDATSQFISGNVRAGIAMENVSGGFIGQSNRIGVGGDGTTRLGNGRQGIVLTDTANVSVFPGLVAYNGGAGVAIVGFASTGDQVIAGTNRANAGLPIDLDDDGPTANDPGDNDGGPNFLLNYPVLTTVNGGAISGTTCANCTVWIYQAFGDAHGPGGGGTAVTHVTAGPGGTWSTTLPGGLTWRDISMVACAAPCASTSNTSEMSPSAPLIRLYLPLLRR